MTSKYLEFKPWPHDSRRTTDRWQVRAVTTGDPLGVIQFKASWRRYVFEPSEHTTFDANCLLDLANFLAERTKEHKAQ